MTLRLGSLKTSGASGAAVITAVEEVVEADGFKVFELTGTVAPADGAGFYATFSGLRLASRAAPAVGDNVSVVYDPADHSPIAENLEPG